jgi:spore coat protein U-like protein
MKKSSIILFGLSLILNTTQSEAAVTCDISSTGLLFGSINPLSSAEVSSIGQISLTCLGGPVSYTIKLSQGNGSMLQRLMKSGLNNLKYNIYTSNSHSTVLGDGTAGSQTINGASTTDITAATYFAFGKVSNIGLAGTFAGTYTDSISLTVIY